MLGVNTLATARKIEGVNNKHVHEPYPPKVLTHNTLATDLFIF